VVVFLAFAALYLALGRRVNGPAAMIENVPFDADVFRVVGDLTRPEFGHYRTLVHPFFVLIFLPPGALLAKLTGSGYEGARWLTALAAAAAVAMFERILRRVARGPRELPWLLTLLYGLSASTLVLGTIPETYMFAVLTILPTYALLAAGVTRPAAWGGALLAALSVTSSNVVQACLGYRFTLAGCPLFRMAIRPIVAVAIAVIALTLVQLLIFPSTVPPWARFEELTYTHVADVISPAAWARTARAVLLDTFVGRDVQVVDGRVVARVGTALGAGGVVVAALWLGLLGFAVRGAARRWSERPPLVPVVALSLGFNILLHVVYGASQVFLYSPHWAFLLVLVLALGLPERPGAWLRAAVAVLTVAVIVHNAWFFARYLEALDRVAALQG
jgi:uncharacterized protein DUF6080